MRCLTFLLVLTASIAAQQSPKRVFIEEHTAHYSHTNCVAGSNSANCYEHERTRDVSAELTRDMMKQCPAVMVITDDRGAADFVLHIAQGSSSLYNAKGDIVFISGARFRVSNVGKDVCKFLGKS